MCSERRSVRLRMNHPGLRGQILEGAGGGGGEDKSNNGRKKIRPLRQFFAPRISTSSSLARPHYLPLTRAGGAGGGGNTPLYELYHCVIGEKTF